MKTHPTLDIGIPAYNEAFNIIRLLTRLLQQESIDWTMGKIVVYSDGSTDNTVKLIERLNHKSIRLIKSTTRRGQAHAQQQLIKHASSDYLVLLNADVLPDSNHFLSELIRPFLKDSNTGMTSAQAVSLKGDSLFSKIIVWSHEVKSKLYTSLASPSVYLCHGRARAFSHRFYTQLTFPKVIAEDAYSYFRCLELGYKFAYCPKARVLFKSPDSLTDHFLQSRRFFRGTKELNTYFSPSVIAGAYHLPIRLVISTWGVALAQRPFYASAYILILASSFLTNFIGKTDTGVAWTPSISSKKL